MHSDNEILNSIWKIDNNKNIINILSAFIQLESYSAPWFQCTLPLCILKYTLNNVFLNYIIQLHNELWIA